MPQNKLYATILVLIQVIASAAIFLSGPVWMENLVLKILFLSTISLAIWAILTMKISNLKISPEVKQNSTLIKHGPYKYIRHPMYTSLLLATLILVVNNFSLLRSFLWIMLLIDILFKLNYEEKLLNHYFSEYKNYRNQTKALIPFIY